MELLSIVIIAIFIGWWLSTSDIAYSLRSILASRVMRDYNVLFFLLIFIIIGGVLFADSLSEEIKNKAQLTTPISSIIITISASLAVLITYKVSKLSSICYAVMGAILGWQLFINNNLDYIYILKLIFVWIIVLFISVGLSAFLYKIYRSSFIRSQMHFIKLSIYLKIGIIITLILFAIAIGFNNGSILIALNSTIKTNLYVSFYTLHISGQYVMFVISIGIILLVTYWKTIKSLSNAYIDNYDLSTEATLCVIISNIIILSCFSFPNFINLIGLEASPISISQITYGGTLGVCLLRNQTQIDSAKIVRLFISILLTPAIAFILAYLIFNIINKQSILFNERSESTFQSTSIINITIPLIIILAISSLAGIFIYFKNQKRINAKTQREALKSQENLFENQKTLSLLEVKAVVFENESLNAKLELKRQELINIALNISEQKTFLDEIYNEVKNVKTVSNPQDKDKKLEEIEKQILQKMNFSQEIESFYTQIEKLHKDFNIRLTMQYPNLTENEKRLIALLRLGFSTKHISTLMNISPKSVEIARYRLRNKLGLVHEQKLINFLKSI